MQNRPMPIVHYIVKVIATLLPCLIAMYALYYFEVSQVWDASTPFRDAMTIAIMGVAMSTSFLLFSVLHTK